MQRLYVIATIALTLALPATHASARGGSDPTGPVLSLLEELEANPDELDSVAARLREGLSKLKTQVETDREGLEELRISLTKQRETETTSSTRVKELERALNEARVALETSVKEVGVSLEALTLREPELLKTETSLRTYETALRLVEASRSKQAKKSLDETPSAVDIPVNLVATLPKPTDAQHELFNTRVLPVLADNCFGCHGEEKQESGMRLDSLAGMLAGGERGPAVVPGDPGESRLIAAIRQEGDLKMPPTGKLGSVATALVTEWVRSGASFGKDESPALAIAPSPTPKPVDQTVVAKSEVDPGEIPPSKKSVSFATALTNLKKKNTALSAATIDRIKSAQSAVETSTVSFNRDILPILSNNCFACHGPDQATREGGLSLHKPEGAYGDLESGSVPVVPGDRDASALFNRITAEDPDDRMPPSDFDKELSENDIAQLTRWIDEGAPWEGHWSFVPAKAPKLPELANADWLRNDIDRFILARLEAEGLTPSPEADARALIRRVTLDLTGLPPTPEEVRAFLADEAPGAYGRVVDRLLDSPRYGEHKARIWLDAARYADTNGYHIDNERYMWPWRDWAIRSFNTNMSFDRFTVSQLAGDLLPDPTQDDLIATGFNRNHMINFEGGAIPEEYHTQYVIDRVNTTGTVWMGLTVGCAQCHDHKYDPISQREFYQLYSFFYNVSEDGLDGRDGNAKPTIKVPSTEQNIELNGVRALLGLAAEAMAVPMPTVDAAQAEWASEWTDTLNARWSALTGASVTGTEGETFTLLEDASVLIGGTNPAKTTYELVADLPTSTVSAIRLDVLQDESLPKGGPGRAENANFILTGFEAEILRPGAEAEPLKIEFASATADFSQKNFDVAGVIDTNAESGWAGLGVYAPQQRTALFIAREPLHVEAGSRIRVRLKHTSKSAGHGIGRFKLSTTNDETLAPSRLGSWYVSGPYAAENGKTAYETVYEPEVGVDLEATYDDGRMKWVQATPAYEDGKVHRLSGDVATTYLYRVIKAPSDRNAQLALGSNDAIKVWLNGDVVHDNNVERGFQLDQDKVNIRLKEGENELLMKVVNYGNDYAFSFRKASEQSGELPLDIELILTSGDRNTRETRRLRNYYRERYSPIWKSVIAKRDELRAREKEIDAQVPTTMVMSEMADPRETHVLVRGQYDQKDKVVTSATPAALPPMPKGTEANRLGLAKWLVDPANPLTARVITNRYWQHHFGNGIVKTAEDFGAQGDRPSHPALMDWLATEFVDSGWDTKHIHRLIVTSATYRQSSRSSRELNERDPENRLLARGPRFRMDAEVIRDSALYVSGLLVEQQGGPSVRPFQPPGIWKEVAYGASFTAQVFEPDTGDNLHRRSMYTFWKRQAPPPNMMIFDAPNRETCVVRRERTNTPLQALTLMNDPQFVEAAHALAHRMVEQGGDDASERIAYAFEWATSRPPTDEERRILFDVFEAQRTEFVESPDAAKTLLAVCDSTHEGTAELAAYSMIANLILNLDEALTKG